MLHPTIGAWAGLAGYPEPHSRREGDAMRPWLAFQRLQCGNPGDGVEGKKAFFLPCFLLSESVEGIDRVEDQCFSSALSLGVVHRTS